MRPLTHIFQAIKSENPNLFRIWGMGTERGCDYAL
jgi:hypothetical protein